MNCVVSVADPAGDCIETALVRHVAYRGDSSVGSGYGVEYTSRGAQIHNVLFRRRVIESFISPAGLYCK